MGLRKKWIRDNIYLFYTQGGTNIMNIDLKNNNDLLEEYIQYIQDDKQIKKIRTGFNKLDTLLNGGLPNGLITLGAIPSLGKTTFALQMADNMASVENTKVLFFSLEMNRFDIISKSLSRLSYTSNELSNYTYDDLLSNNEAVDYKTLLSQYEPIANNLYTIDYIYNIQDIEAFIRQFKDLHEENNIVVIIDYLQYILCGNNGNDKQVIDNITKRLKELAKELNICIIEISSLNRTNYSGSITMESFKESGSIEYTSDILIGLEYVNNGANEREYEAKRNPRKIALSVIKNRYGALGKVNYDFYTPYHTFIEK